MHADDDRKTEFEKIATNEPFLFGYRMIVAVVSFYLAFVGTKILHTNEDLADKVAQLRYDAAIRGAAIETKADVLNSRVDALSGRLTSLDTRVDALNARIIEMLRGAGH